MSNKNHSVVSVRKHTLEFGKKTFCMGILNITPDSFSDGGKYLDPEIALEKALELEKDGADIIDIGGESSRPGSDTISAKEELNRIMPVLKELVKKIKIPISIDTYKPEVAKEVLEAGADIINDITGLHNNEQLAKLVAKYDAGIIVMHMLGTPKTMQANPQYKDLIGEIIAYFKKSIDIAKVNGIKEDKIIIDPGIGFGKTIEHNLEIIRKLSAFKSIGRPILLGTSRKSFIGNILNLPVNERLEGTAASVAIGIMNGADIVRVHDIKEMKRVIKIADAIKYPKEIRIGE
ncbi:MAG: dihydropteroate synthase [Candidatus Firestonebacteria bacterium]